VKNRKALDVTAGLAAGALATLLGHDIASHGVSVLTTIAASTGMFTAWMWLFTGFINGSRTRTYSCKQCPVTIRATNVDAAEQRRLRELAVNHDRHAAPVGE
jgi:hypothetical protein